jgi:CRP-like cAMP-binding protein
VIEDAPVKELERLLAMVDILEPLQPEEVERVALLSSSMRLKAGEAVALDEDRRTLLLLVSGHVRGHEASDGGQDLTISMVEDGTVVGHTGFAARLSRELRVEALQPSTLLVLGWEDFEDLVLRNPEVGVKTIRLLRERIAVCEGRLSDMVRKEVPARVAGLLLELSEHQGVDPSRRNPGSGRGTLRWVDEIGGTPRLPVVARRSRTPLRRTSVSVRWPGFAPRAAPRPPAPGLRGP